MVVKRQCSFCAGEVEPGTGTMFVKRDGTVFFFCSASCRKQQLHLGRVGHRLKWTRAHALKRAAQQSQVARAPRPIAGRVAARPAAPRPSAPTPTPAPAPVEPTPTATPTPRPEPAEAASAPAGPARPKKPAARKSAGEKTSDKEPTQEKPSRSTEPRAKKPKSSEKKTAE